MHRDLKPGNVLLEDGEPVVIDFGIAHIADDVRLTSSGLVMGTPGYLSPEVIGGSPVTQATDWWGWAATLAFAASGRPPFGRGPMDVVLGRVSRGETDLTGVDQRLSPLLAAALSPDPARRPPTSEVVAALERYASGGPAAPAAPTTSLRNGQPWTPDWANPPGPGAYGSDAYGLDPHPAQSGSTSALPGTVADDGEDHDALDDEEQSDWQAAWDADPQEPDPRINRPRRTGTLLALAAAFTATAATWPGIALLLGVIWCWLARFSDRSVTALILRRYRYGRRRADLPMAVVLSPWHLVVSAGLALARAHRAGPRRDVGGVLRHPRGVRADLDEGRSGARAVGGGRVRGRDAHRVVGSGRGLAAAGFALAGPGCGAWRDPHGSGRRSAASRGRGAHGAGLRAARSAHLVAVPLGELTGAFRVR